MKIEIHPLSATVGAVATVLLLFACSSSGGGSAGIPPLQPTPSVSTQVTFYSETSTPTGTSWPFAYAMGTTTAPTVITDVSWAGRSSRSRLLVNGAPVYSWGFGGEHTQSSQSGFAAYAVAPRFSLAHGIKVPANAVLIVETEGSLGAVSLAGYTQ